MQVRHSSSKLAVSGRIPTAAVLLSVICGPVLAASGVEGLCANVGNLQPDLSIPTEELGVEIVDHGVSTNALPEPDVEVRNARLPLSLSITPRVDTILRQIFDETPADGDENLAATPAGAADAASIAELALPNHAERRTETKQPEPGRSDSSIEVMSPRLPGVPEAETIRFRRQMYRTDI